MECQVDKNKKDYGCTYEPYSRKGMCCECLRYHFQMGELPGGCSHRKWREHMIDQSRDSLPVTKNNAESNITK